MGLNAGGVKVPLYGIIHGIWHAKPVTANLIKTQNNQITVNGDMGMILPATYYIV